MFEDQEPVPEVVYHYTSMDTLLKIVESQSIWTTCIDYLNDVMEFSFYLEEVQERVKGLVSQGHEHSKFFEDYLKEQRKKPFEVIVSRRFVASFSGKADFLPQWRSYCPQGNGVCIGFRTDCLKRSALIPELVEDEPALFRSVRFKKVTYGVPSPKEFDEEIIKTYQAALIIAGDDSPKWHHVLYFRSLLGIQASIQKHPSFEPENEYRLIADGLMADEQLIQYRASRTTLVPYVGLHLPATASTELSLHSAGNEVRSRSFIHNVTIGPTPNMELSVRALRSFFSKKRMSVKVIRSRVPYRDW